MKGLPAYPRLNFPNIGSKTAKSYSAKLQTLGGTFKHIPPRTTGYFLVPKIFTLFDIFISYNESTNISYFMTNEVGIFFEPSSLVATNFATVFFASHPRTSKCKAHRTSHSGRSAQRCFLETEDEFGEDVGFF